MKNNLIACFSIRKISIGSEAFIENGFMLPETNVNLKFDPGNCAIFRIGLVDNLRFAHLLFCRQELKCYCGCQFSGSIRFIVNRIKFCDVHAHQFAAFR